MGQFTDSLQTLNHISKIPVRIKASEEIFQINSAYECLVKAAYTALLQKKSQSILMWPKSPTGVPVIHPLLQLLLMSDVSIDTEAGAFHSLFFPGGRWIKNNKDVHIDRDWILNIVRQRFTKVHANKNEDAVFHTLLTLVRLANLESIHLESENEIFAHPIVDELTLTHHLTTGAQNHLLYEYLRIKDSNNRKAKTLNRGTLADEPNTAVWCLTIADKEARMFSKLNKCPDIILLDLSKKNIPRVNLNEFVLKPLNLVREKFQKEVPVVVVTDLPWVHERLQSYILPKYSKMIAVDQTVKFNKFDNLCEKERAVNFSGFDSVRVSPADAGFGAILGRLKRLSAELEKSDFELSVKLNECFERITNRINFPVPYSTLLKFVDESRENSDIDLCNAVLESCIPRFRKDEYTSIAAQKNNEFLSELEGNIAVLNSKLDASPVFTLLNNLLNQLVKAPTKTMLVVQEPFFIDLIEYAISSNVEVGDLISRGILTTLNLSDFHDLSKASNFENTRVVFLQLRKDAILDLLSLENMSKENIFIGNGEVFKSLYQELKRLLKYQEFLVLHDRFNLMSKAISATIISGLYSVVKLNDDGPSDFEFKLEGKIIDMRPKNSTGAYVQIVSQDGKRVLAAKGSKVITYDKSNPVNPFSSAIAEDLDEDVEICPIGEVFLQVARESIYSHVAATNEVREYHKGISRALLNIKGGTLREKATLIRQMMFAKMGNSTPGVYSVLSWIDVEKYNGDDLKFLRPNAPQKWEVFKVFMESLNINPEVAILFWNQGVVTTRSIRLSNGHDFHSTYLAILVSPEKVILRNPSFSNVIQILRDLAEKSIVRVRKVSIEIS